VLYSAVNEIEVNPQIKASMKYTKMVTGGTNYNGTVEDTNYKE
jgi:hypothetical protein